MSRISTRDWLEFLPRSGYERSHFFSRCRPASLQKLINRGDDDFGIFIERLMCPALDGQQSCIWELHSPFSAAPIGCISILGSMNREDRHRNLRKIGACQIYSLDRGE